MADTQLTIAIATYNGADHIAASVSSAIATGARVIVSDDGSKDSTLEMLDAFADQVTVHQQPRNLGIQANYQFLLAQCSTPLAMFLNQDDTVDPGSVRSMRFKPGTVSVCNGWLIDEDDRRNGLIYRRPPIHALIRGVEAGLIHTNFIRTPSQVVFPVREAQEVGGFVIPDAQGQGSEDWMLWLRLAGSRVPFELRMFPRMSYRLHAGNYSNNTESLRASRDAVASSLGVRVSRERLRVRW